MDDFVKLLVAIVIGQFLRDVHLIRDGLRAELVSQSVFLAELFPYVFVALVVRNVHASFRYDQWSEARGFSPEKGVAGRAVSFVFGLVALFVSAYVVEHVLARHFAAGAPPSPTGGGLPPFEMSLLTVFLVMPFLVYFLWDLWLWVLSDRPKHRKDRVMERFVRRWLILDIGGLLWLLLCLACHTLASTTPQGQMLATVASFAVLAGGTVLADYGWNVSFYFKEIRPARHRGGRHERRGDGEAVDAKSTTA